MSADLLHTPMPAFPPTTVLNRVEQLYGIRASEATALPSERDQLLLLPATSAGDVVVKVSNRAESAHTLAMENGALAHLATVDPGLPVPRLVPTRTGEPLGSITDGEGHTHLTRVLTVVPGQPIEGQPVAGPLAEQIGAACARIAVGLQGYFHPDAGRRIAWDIRIQRTPPSDPHDPVARLLADAPARIRPALAATYALPSGVQHAHVTHTNVRSDSGTTVTGVVDFGDMHHTAAACDLATSLTSVLRNTASVQLATWWELAGAFVDGYQRVRPLQPAEAAVLGHLVLARLITTLDISRERADEHPQNRRYIVQYDASTERLLAELTELSDGELAHRFSRLVGMPTRPPADHLAARRAAVLGGRLAPTFYRQPLTVVAGEDAWLIGDEGERYLDAYNNVAVAGHTHPAITEAVVTQLRTLNTHSRYLHPAIVELAERLTATMPPGLDTCVFVTSGSEAVDLAWRMARAFSGAGGTLVAEWAYHGISARTIDFSPNEWRTGTWAPSDVATFTAPHAGATLTHTEARQRVLAAADRLQPHRVGLLIADPQFTSEGILDAPPEFMQGLVDGVHEAGGLFLADEVQSGFGRSGPALWRFATQGITPDLVTLGKPMAAGLPVGAVITRREIALALPYEYFSTFAGSPLAGVAGRAVLDVLTDRQLPQRAVHVGEHLRARLRELATDFPSIGAVRGTGLIAGVDLRAPEPDRHRTFTADVVEGLRHRHVLAGATGRGGDVLKIRPPLAWREEHADRFGAALRATLDDLAAGRSARIAP
ncbi:MAG: aminotransferase class III-fold pyridoxal phosphate-dependent enzyme [Micromonosporaceae bacterium]